MRRRVSLALLATVVLVTGVAPAVSAKQGAPPRTTAVIDWRMPDLTPDADGDGVIDRYLDGNRSADVPADGRYDVVLDGCASRNVASYEWQVGPRKIQTTDCETTVRLPEGQHRVKLKTRGPVRTAVAVTRIDVQTHIVLGLGDSYGAGSGAQAFTDNPVAGGYFDATCGRTPRSHQALTALELERSDPRSSVILIHLSCGGAQIDPGVLTPFRGQRPQVDQGRDLLNGQPIDSVLLSIGGNDIGFGAILQLCQLTPGIDCATAPFGGFPTFHEFLQEQFSFLRDGNPGEPLGSLPVLAECLGGSGCATSETPDGSGEPLAVNPRDVVYTTYPDLARDDDGRFCDAVPGSPDPGLANSTAAEWAWLDAVVQSLDNPGSYSYTDAGGVTTELDVTSLGLNAVIAETTERYGWTSVPGVYANAFSDSVGHGYCADTYDPATASGRWTYRWRAADEPTVFPPGLLVPVHPNAGGHGHYTHEILEALGG